MSAATIPIVPVVGDAGSGGKTTSVVTLAALLAGAGRRVLVIDADPQANATRAVGADPDTTAHTAGSVMLREATLEEAVIDTVVAGLLLVPASVRLRSQRVELDGVTAGEQRLKLALRGAHTLADVVLIDCQAGVGELLPLSALVAATAALTVTLPSTKELEGVPRVEQVVADIAEAYNPDLRLAGVIPCAVPPASSGRLYVDAHAALREAYGDLVTPPVRRSVVAARAYDAQRPLPLYAPDEAVTTDYRHVLEHLQTRGVL